jgi:hypothetical protein
MIQASSAPPASRSYRRRNAAGVLLESFVYLASVGLISTPTLPRRPSSDPRFSLNIFSFLSVTRSTGHETVHKTKSHKPRVGRSRLGAWAVRSEDSEKENDPRRPDVRTQKVGAQIASHSIGDAALAAMRQRWYPLGLPATTQAGLPSVPGLLGCSVTRPFLAYYPCDANGK